MSTHHLAMLLGVVGTVAGQLLLKKGALVKGTASSLFHPFTLAGYGTFLVVTLLNLYALKGVEMSVLAIWASLSFPLAVLMAKLFFKERVEAKHLVGATLIVLGISVFSL